MINYKYKNNCLVKQKEINELFEKINALIKKISNEQKKRYETEYAFANVPLDETNLKIVNELVLRKKKLNPTALVVIGIGGSNLGTKAIHEFINGKLYNEKNPKIKVYFADTVDTDNISTILSLVENELEKKNNVIINVVSKSGKTTETVANYEIFLELLKKYKKDEYKDSVVVTTDKDSVLWNYAKQINCDVLEIPKNVGGRFSVFTSVGIFPLAMLDINVNELLIGAKEGSNNSLAESIENNYAAINASIAYYLYKNKCIIINDIFLFGNDLEGIGKWYRQLMGESIGKEFNINNEKVNVGITPTVSIGSTDLHSVGQLYLGGPIDKFTNFIVIEQQFTNLKVPDYKEFEKIVQSISNVELKRIMDAIISGTQESYLKKNRPFSTYSLNKKNEQTIAYFMQLKMFEIIYLAHLLNINPFDQPNVELYKIETQKILKSKKKE